MRQPIQEQISNLQKEFVGKILTYAEVGLPESQFKPFKRLVMNLLHESLQPELIQILQKNGSGQGSAIVDRFDKKGG